jgi:hypothetical protein
LAFSSRIAAIFSKLWFISAIPFSSRFVFSENRSKSESEILFCARSKIAFCSGVSVPDFSGARERSIAACKSLSVIV